MKLKLFRPRTVWLPTWQGGLALFALAVVCGWISFTHIYLFLALRDPVASELLVVEGWASDAVLQRAQQEFQQNHYRLLLTAGGPLEVGSYLKEHQSFAEVAAASLRKMGVADNQVVAVPGPKVTMDRTYQSAVALRKWLESHEPQQTSVNVISVAAHARRTRLLFEKALGPKMRVGIISQDGEEYNAGNWWRRSAGVRDVVGELIAYGYARLVFRPPANDF